MDFCWHTFYVGRFCTYRAGIWWRGAGTAIIVIYYRSANYLVTYNRHALVIFSGLTLRTRLNNVDWHYLRKSAVYIIPAAIVGVLGLLNLPNTWLVIFVYSVTLFYAITWVLNWVISSHNDWADKLLLILGGYVAGTSLTGAPLMVAVFMRHIRRDQLRNTLFVLWFILVSIKMTAFATLGVSLYFLTAVVLVPIAAIGHYLGLRSHDKILENDQLFKRVIGGVLIIICIAGMARVLV